MFRVFVYVVGAPRLANFSRVHDVDAIRVARNHPEVVGDYDYGCADLLGQVLHQFKDLSLNRHVQSCRRLVGYEQLGVAAHGDGYHHALALASGELMRVVAYPSGRIGDANHLQQFDCALVGLLFRHVQVKFERFPQLPADRQYRR